MSRYKYVKQTPKRPIKVPLLISLVLMVFGGGMLAWVAWPILSFSVFTAPLFQSVITPIQDITVASTGSGKSLAAYADTGVETVPLQGADFTNPNIWFPAKPQKNIVTPVNTYSLSIPKLGVRDAVAIISGDDLNESLIHYGGTALPGEYGNGVIFGHSVLPQFFDPKNYMTIFSTLPTLKEGDSIFIKFDGITYKYEVIDMTVRDPSDLSALEQQYDDSYVTLITCVPPGTYWKRLNVRAKLVSI